MSHNKYLYLLFFPTVVFVFFFCYSHFQFVQVDGFPRTPAKFSYFVPSNVPSILEVLSDHSTVDESNIEIEICDRAFHTFVSNHRKCLLEKLNKKSVWKELQWETGRCLGDTIRSMLDIRVLPCAGDLKWLIPPTKSVQNASDFNCTHVTLGVGNDISAEKQVRDLVPTCRFYGADPTLANGKVYKKIGTYFEIAVGAKQGFLQASVLEKGVYRNKKVKTVTFMDFVRNYAKVDHIDFLFMDNEGPEFELFSQFKADGPIGKSNITICQISVEMHGPLKNYGMNETRVNELFRLVIEHTPFLPFVSTDSNGWPHIRTFYINVEDEYCIRTYYRERFCGMK